MRADKDTGYPFPVEIRRSALGGWWLYAYNGNDLRIVCSTRTGARFRAWRMRRRMLRGAVWPGVLR